MPIEFSRRSSDGRLTLVLDPEHCANVATFYALSSKSNLNQDEMLAKAYENGKAINVASFLEFDDVIDPAGTRTYIVRALKSVPTLDRSAGKLRPLIEAW